MYANTNYNTKKALRAAVDAGETVGAYQPGGMFPSQTDGEAVVEGPHYPQPHKWYARVLLADGAIVKVLG